MILNSYNLKKSLLMKKKNEQYKNNITIIPANDIYSLTSNFIEKQKKYVEEIKNVDTTPKKKNKKKGLPTVLDLSDLDMVILPEEKKDPEEKGEENIDDIEVVEIDDKMEENDKVEKDDKVEEDVEEEELDEEGDKKEEEVKKDEDDMIIVNQKEYKKEDDDENPVVDNDDEKPVVDDEGVKVDEDMKDEEDMKDVEDEGDGKVKEEVKKGGGDSNVKKIVVTSFF